MAEQLEGLVYFPGIHQIVDANMAFCAHGISPSICTITIAPQADFIAQVGTLSWTFNGTQIDFPNCKIDTDSFEYNLQGFVTRLKILDRRWKWKWGAIGGHYNLRNPDGSIRSDTNFKTPQELATLLLDCMQEEAYDVSALPNDTRPMIDWDGDVPMEALADLCESLGCHIVFGLDNSVTICRVGQGADLPTDGIQANSYTLTVPDAPKSIAIITNKIGYELALPLEPVGLDDAGGGKKFIAKIDDLSYTPDDGWGSIVPPDFVGVKKTFRPLAQQTVYKWYRVQLPIDLPDGQKITSYDQFTVVPRLLESWRDADNIKHPCEPVVFGIWLRGGYNGASTSNVSDTVDPDDLGQIVFDNSFDVDVSDPRQGAVVKFSEWIYQNSIRPSATAGEVTYAPATLWLVATVLLRESETLGFYHYIRERDLGGDTYTPPKYVRHDEILPGVIAHYIAVGPSKLFMDDYKNNYDLDFDGEPGVNDWCDYYLDAIEASFQAPTPQTIIYNGLRAIQPDGAIYQLTFSRTAEGMTTTVCRNTEQVLWTIPFYERRMLEKLRNIDHWKSMVETPTKWRIFGPRTSAE